MARTSTRKWLPSINQKSDIDAAHITILDSVQDALPKHGASTKLVIAKVKHLYNRNRRPGKGWKKKAGYNPNVFKGSRYVRLCKPDKSVKAEIASKRFEAKIVVTFVDSHGVPLATVSHFRCYPITELGTKRSAR